MDVIAGEWAGRFSAYGDSALARLALIWIRPPWHVFRFCACSNGCCGAVSWRMHSCSDGTGPLTHHRMRQHNLYRFEVAYREPDPSSWSEPGVVLATVKVWPVNGGASI
jgi:hypothetical protein